MRGRVLAAVIAAAAVGAALAALAADHGPGPDAVAEPTGERSGASGAAPAGTQHGAILPATARPAPKQARVAAGVLVRAASRRAQERDQARPYAPERRRAREQGDVIVSIEIDWHASGAADR